MSAAHTVQAPQTAQPQADPPQVRPPQDDAPGRTCPLQYRYQPAVFASPAPADLQDLEVLYVVGGLYGNPLALDAVLARFAQESGRKRLVFNGDFHWFDTDPALFAQVQRGVLAHRALRGNVETELAAPPPDEGEDPGCGCAYPEWVGDAVVARSNRIHARLRQAPSAAERAQLQALPMWLRADAAGLRIGIVHGDAQSLAGWGFAQEHLRDPAHLDTVRDWFARAQVDAFACTHTCLPVFQQLGLAGDGRHGWVFNNGASGMPNFSGDTAGLLTRIATTPVSDETRRFGVRVGEAHIDAIALDIDQHRWRDTFLRQWPAGSDAHTSYFERICRGPDYALADAVRHAAQAPLSAASRSAAACGP